MIILASWWDNKWQSNNCEWLDSHHPQFAETVAAMVHAAENSRMSGESVSLDYIEDCPEKCDGSTADSLPTS